MPDEYDLLLDSVLPKRRKSNYDDIIDRNASQFGVDANLVRAVIGQESSGNPRATSPKGAGGLMQLMPATAARYGVKDRYDPEQNIRGGIQYLRDLNEMFSGNVDLVLAGYNAGEGAVKKFGNRIPPYRETQNYVPAVKARYRKITGQNEPASKRDAYDDLLDAVMQPAPATKQDAPPPPANNRYAAMARIAQKPVTGVRGRITLPPSVGMGDVRRAEAAEQRVVQDTGMGPLRQIDEPEVRRVQRVQGDIRREQTEGERALRLAPGTAQARLFDPKLNENEEMIRRLTAERDEEKRQADYRAETDRLISQFTPEDKQQRLDVATQLKRHQPGVARGIDVGVQRGASNVLYKLAGIVDMPALIDFLPGVRGVRKSVVDNLRRKALANELALEDIQSLPQPAREQIAQFLTETAIGLGELAATPGGVVTKFSTLAGAEAVGRNRPTEEVIGEAAKGAALGTVQKYGEALAPATASYGWRLARSAPAIGAGSAAVELATGATPREAALSAVTNAAFQGLGEIGRGKRLTRGKSVDAAELPNLPPELPVNDALVPTKPTQGAELQSPPAFIDERSQQPVLLQRSKETSIRQEPVDRLETTIEQRARQQDLLVQLNTELATWERAKGVGKRGQGKISALQQEKRAIEQDLARQDAEAGARLAEEESQRIEATRYSETPRFDEWAENESGQRLDQLEPSEIEDLRSRYRKEFAEGPSAPLLREMPALDAPLEIRTKPHHSTQQPRRVRGTGKGRFKKGKPRNEELKRTPVVTTESMRESPVITEAKVEAPLTRAALQVPEPRVERPQLTLVRNQAERSFPKSAEAAGLPGGENRTYDPLTNEESLTKADKRIAEVGAERAATEIAMRREATPEDVATGIRLMQTFTQAGDHGRAADVANDLAVKLTRAGQSVQAASIISQLSPEGVLIAAQRQLPEGKKLTTAQSEALTSQAKIVQEKDAVLVRIESEIAKAQAQVEPRVTGKPKLAEKIGTVEDRLVKLEQEARARLAARQQAIQSGSGLGKEAGASAIPLDLADFAIVGAAKIARKGMSTAKWTAEMVEEFGETIRPYLRAIYRDSYALYNEEKNAMKAESQERSIKRENPAVTDPVELQQLIEKRALARKDARTARAEMSRLFIDLTATPLSRVKTIAGDVLNIPRTMKSSMDLSAPRQGAMWMINHPVQGVKTFFNKQIRAMKESNFDKFVDELEADPDYPLMVRSKLALTTTDTRPNALTAREEAFMSKLAGKIPGIKHSERAYTTFMDTARSSWFKQLKSLAEIKAKDEGRQVTNAEYEAIASFVNIATGRGNLGKGWLNETSPFLNAVFFAPKFAVSKVQIFDPRVYARLPKGARRQAMREAATYYGAMITTAMLLKFGLGLTVGTDPEDSEFMKLRVGNTRYDLANGTGQYVVLASRLLRNAENKRTGKKDKFGRSISDNIDRFTRYKYSPPAAFTRNVWEGKNAIGEKTSAKGEAVELITPLFLNDLYDAYKEEGLTGVGKHAPGFVGVGVNTYGDRKKKRAVVN